MLITSAFLPQQIDAQSPEKMSYQAVVRNVNNELVSNQAVGMKISILQGSTSGTSIFSETQNPSTNANGLVSIEIGSGTTSDDFSAIDWANGPYFIKTETDPTGGTNYSITGTSQLMSVPYALHAKTAENVIGGISETDPLFSKSIAGSITKKDTAIWRNHTQVNSKSIATLGFASGPHINADDIAKMGFITGSAVGKYSVGDFAMGGVVFWVDESGQHGLICAKNNVGNVIRWNAGTNGNTRAYGDGPFSGEMNTNIIISRNGSIGDDGNTYAARICAEYQNTEGGKTYGDWYLPSLIELNLMIENKDVIDVVSVKNDGNAILDEFYWSSVEFDDSTAWAKRMSDGSQDINGKSSTIYVRPIRAF